MEQYHLTVYFGSSPLESKRTYLRQSTSIADKFTKQQKLDRLHVMLEKIKQRLEYEIELEYANRT